MICEHYTGIRLGLFTPDQAFDVVAKSQIEKLRKPCLNIIQLVSAELYKVATSGVEKVALMQHYWVALSAFERLWPVHVSTCHYVCY